jgi:two-component system, NarL family, response regulator DevR
MDISRTAVLLDRHPLWLDAVEQVLTKIQIEVLGRSTVPQEMVALVAEHEPDVLVAELEDTSTDGAALAALREAHDRVPKLKTVVLSAVDDPKRVEAAFAAGAVAYVIKTAQPEDLSAAVRQAFDHSIYFAGQAQPVPQATVHSIGEASVLTRRELEILQLVAEGKSNAQVGRTLWVTEQTVKFHLSNIYRKLDVSNRTEASRWAQMRNLLPAPETPEAAYGGR